MLAKFSPPSFHTHGLRLRAIRQDDAETWFSYLTNDRVTSLTSWSAEAVADLKPLIDTCLAETSDSPIRFVLAEHSSDELVGTIGFHSINPQNRVAEVAYDLCPRLWGQGIITEACRAVVEWGFDELGFNRIQATAMVGNLASARVLEKCGFTLEGTLRQYRFARGVARDFWMYSKLKHEN